MHFLLVFAKIFHFPGKKHLISPVDFEIGLQNQAGLGEKEAEGV